MVILTIGVSKLIDLSLAFNKAPILNYTDLDNYIQNDVEVRPQSVNLPG